MSALPSTYSVPAASVDSLPKGAETSDAEQLSYKQILKSSALIGGSSIANIVIGIIRTKMMALLIGPSGVGLAGLYGSIVDLGQSISGMGINSSGVRQIAEAVGSNDIQRVARTGLVLRRASLLLGVLGAALLVGFSRQVSTVTFGTDQHAALVSVLSAAVLFRLVAAGQGALIQGMRRISDLAKLTVVGALLGTAVSILLVYVLREDGVVPSLVVAAGLSAATAWWYSRKIHLPTPSLTAPQVRQEASGLLKLGFAFMASGLMTMGAAYVIRLMILRTLGFEATGLYQSAWTIGGLYIGFILQAMGSDFYPRLTASASDNTASNRMVNEQARVGLLLGGPGALATLTFAPVVVALFYSAEFGGAVELLRWICLGAALRVLTWPMGFVILAKGRQTLFFWSELAWTTVNVGLTWLCMAVFGLAGVGIAFAGSYVFHGILVYQIVRRLSGFSWSSENKHTGLLFGSLITAVFASFYLFPFMWASLVGASACIVSSVQSYNTLVTLAPLDRIIRPLRGVLTWLGATRPTSTTAT